MYQRYFQEWSEFVNWVHAELSDCKKELTQMQEMTVSYQVKI